MRHFALLCITFCLAFANLAQAAELPDLGNPADAALSKSKAAQLGRSVMMQLRQAGAIDEDPLLAEYIQSVGSKLSSLASDGTQSFHFFVVKNSVINAFSLPGGYIGVNSGLIVATSNESELAAVLAHEISHVTQRHIARAAYDSQRTSILSLAAMIAGLLIGAAGGASGDAMAGIVTASQAAAAQHQISFTRANEKEADRIGIKLLSEAGFNPNAMGDFFETLERRYGASEQNIPRMLMDHPVTTERIAEARARARQLPAAHPADSVGYGLAKARLEVSMASTPAAALAKIQLQPNQDAPDVAYARALALSGLSRDDEADRVFAKLRAEYPEVIAYRIGEAEALAGEKLYDQSIAAYQAALKLFPRNVPLTISYGRTLLEAGQPAKAHHVLLDLLDRVPPTPDQIRLIARAADAEGDMLNAHYYMGEYYVSTGNLPLAIDQLRMALKVPSSDQVEHARLTARLKELIGYLPKKQREQMAD